MLTAAVLNGKKLYSRNKKRRCGWWRQLLHQSRKQNKKGTSFSKLTITLKWKKDTQCSSANTNFRGTKGESGSCRPWGLPQNTASQLPASFKSAGSVDQTSASTPPPTPPHPPSGTCSGASCWQARRRCRMHSSGRPGGQGANGSSVKRMRPG